MNSVLDNDSQVIVNILSTVFPKIRIYENDVPEKFHRPCLLIVRPDNNTTVRELTAAVYEESKVFTVYAFDEKPDEKKSNIDMISKEMEGTKHSLLHYIMGTPKYLIPNSNRRFLTVEIVSVSADSMEAVTEFTIRTKKTLSRDLRRPKTEKIMSVVCNGTVIANGKE